MPIKLSIKQVPVHFDSSTDTTLFKQKVYRNLEQHGLLLTDLNLIHCATIHYQSRFKSSLSRRFRYTFDTIEPSLFEDRKHFYFNGDEKPELQVQSSEVIGVGFAVALFQQLFDVNFNCINEITMTKKRCDFEIIFNGNRVIVESKGRKSNINRAKQEIISQKAAYSSHIPKYGSISIIGRDVDPVEITVVDPPSDIGTIDRYEKILNLLIYYTKVTQIAGYFLLAKKLNERVEEILLDYSRISYFEGKKIEYMENIEKLGFDYTISINNFEFSTFFHINKEIGFNIEIRGIYQLFFGMDNRVKKILEDQDFERLLNFNEEYNINSSNISAHNDGTILLITDKRVLEDSIKNR